MKSFTLQIVIAVAIVTLAAALWLAPRAGAMPSTYAAAIALFLGVGAVMFITWRNARPTETIGQVLQRTETEKAGTPRT